MSTEIRGRFGRVRIEKAVDGVIDVTITDTDGTYPVHRTVPRADFLAAVEAECGVIVIDRTDLPEVESLAPERGYLVGEQVYANGMEADAAEFRRRALAWFALAGYLDANPPVDEAKVDALAAALIDADMDGPEGPTPYTVARRLIAAGWSK